MKKYLFITLLILLFSLFGCDKECDHNFKATDVFPNTCEIDGYTLYRCTECSYTYKGDVKHAPGHVTEITKEGYPATCTESGLTNETSCKVCKQIISSQEKISILGHNYDVWVEVSKPTKTENGLLRRICKTDETHIEEHTLAKLSSESYQYVLTAPTCIALGLETFDYEIDGQKFHYEVVLEKTNHPYVSVVTDPTCEAGGYTTYTCSYCFDTYVSDYVDALGHDYQGVVTDPTCEAKGYTTYICQNDNSHQYVDDYVDALGHQYVTYNYNNDATCEEDGTETATCSNGCGKTDTKIKADTAIGHDYQGVVTDPTCETKGYTTYICQNDNSHQYVDDYVDALGHQYVTYIYNNDAKCEEDGTETASCSNGCGKTDTKVKADTAIGHDYQGVVTDPTCEAKGYTTYICQNDNSHQYVDEYVDALGHQYVTYNYNNDATCEEDGTETATCSNGCGKTDTKVKANTAIGHDYQGVVTDPTCEAKGYTTYICQNDNSHRYIDNYIDALGHRYLTYNYNNDATCEEDGTKTASCANGCGKTDTLNATNTALGHSFTNYRDNNDATCKENGTETAKCDRCSETNERVKADSALGHADDDGDFYCDRCGVPYGNDITMIDSYEDLLLIKQNPAGFFQLTADINLTNQTWDSNFTFYGYLYGDGFTISGLTGSFIEYNNGTIDSLNISGTNISLSYKKEEKDTSITLGKKLDLSYHVSTSVFVTHNNNTIKNCNIKGTVKFDITTHIDYRGAASTECESIANIYFGGFAAENAGTINNCQIQGVIEVTSSNYAYHDITSYFTTYNGERNTSRQNLYFGGFAAINKGDITNCKSTGFISTYFNVTADYDKASVSADGRANAYTTAYLGLIAAKNESKITNVSVNNVPVVNKANVQNSDLKEVGVVGHKTGKEIILSINTLSDYQYLIGENSGTISEVVTKY